MNYKRLSNKELLEYPYPNLIAEIIESGYGLHTISDFMGHGNTYKTKQLITEKLLGKREILADEAFGLAKYLGVSLDYLFSHNLNTLCDVPAAYWRWLDKNRKKMNEIQENQEMEFIGNLLRRNSILSEFMKEAITWNEEEIQQALNWLENWSEKRKSTLQK